MLRIKALNKKYLAKRVVICLLWNTTLQITIYSNKKIFLALYAAKTYIPSPKFKNKFQRNLIPMGCFTRWTEALNRVHFHAQFTHCHCTGRTGNCPHVYCLNIISWAVRNTTGGNLSDFNATVKVIMNMNLFIMIAICFFVMLQG